MRGYLALRAAMDKASSNMPQIVSPFRLCEELALVDEFVPKSIWRMVKGQGHIGRYGILSWLGIVGGHEGHGQEGIKSRGQGFGKLPALSIIY